LAFIEIRSRKPNAEMTITTTVFRNMRLIFTIFTSEMAGVEDAFDPGNADPPQEQQHNAPGGPPEPDVL
jgi:hypothetical protein